ncbi:regulation of nuclear pre-mRNA domain-containing protein 1B [Tanacetum coccineum]
MTQGEKMFVVKAATNKIGATRAHNLLSSMKGGYDYVHGTTDDFKNHQRDANGFIGESDAQMLINKMKNRKMYVPNFTFQYRVETIELVAMFWVDEVAKCNYKEFGDIVSFDATFNSNKYNMKFVPFIGVDNHGKCVTLEPTMIVTDEDGAMKRAIEDVFKKAKHRLSYFVDSPLFGLMRTTSRSESENSFFKSFTSPGATLVSFMMSYESAMERQRSESENSFFKSFISPGATLVSFMMSYESAMERQSEKNKRRKLEQRQKQKETISKDEGGMGTYIEKLKKLLDEVKADMPNPPSRNT